MIPFPSTNMAAIYLHAWASGPCGFFLDSQFGAFGYEYWPSEPDTNPFCGPRVWRENISRILREESHDE